MKDKIATLFIIFILQICLAVGIYFNKEGINAFSNEEGLLEFDAALVDKVFIEDSEEKANLVIEKEHGSWVLSDYHRFPSAASKTEKFIEKFSSIKKSWPVAKTKSTAKRFKVEEDNFRKKISFSSENNKSRIFIGTSPGFKKVHARIPENDEIYEITFNSYEAGVDPEDWMDRKFLKLKYNEIELVEMPSFSLFEKDGEFLLKDLKEKEEIIKGQVKDLIYRVTDLSFEEVLGKEKKPGYRQNSPELVYTLKMKSGNKMKYTFFQQENKEFFILKVSSHDFFFKVGKNEVAKLKELKRDNFVQAKKKVKNEKKASKT